MKIIIFLITIFYSVNIHSQETFAYNNNGLSPAYVVTEFPDKGQNDLYEQTLKYIKETYRNPDEVIQTTIDGELIRISAVESDMFCFQALGMTTCENGHYTISYEFKDGRIKIEPMELYYIASPTQYTSGGRQDFKLNDASHMYNKKEKLRSIFQHVPASIESTLNVSVNSLQNYINGTHTAEKNTEW